MLKMSRTIALEFLAEINLNVVKSSIFVSEINLNVVKSSIFVSMATMEATWLLWMFYLRSPYLIIISAICHCHSFKNELVLVLNTAWRKQPIADNVSNHNRTCGESVSENSE